MKLEVGMYVRTKKGIAKIIDRILEPEHYYFKMWGTDKFLKINDDTEYICEIDVIKSSHNLIGLIEVGDVIETPKGVFQVGYINDNVLYTDDSKIIACLRGDRHLCFENTAVISIVTREQFESVKYVL